MGKHNHNKLIQAFQGMLAVLLCAGYTLSLHAQSYITAAHVPRDGDRIERYTAGMFTPGARGQDRMWDYSDLETEKNRPVRYWQTDSLGTLACKTPGLLRHIRVAGDTVLFLGYETNSLRVALDQPLLSMLLPVSYGDSVHSAFQGRGDLYDRSHARVFGQGYAVADAEGTLITPDGDTLRNVLRLHTHRVQGSRPHGYSHPIPSDSISWILSADNDATTTDTYQWYSPEYKHSVMELTVVTGRDGLQMGAAYYSPPSSMEKMATPDEMNRRNQRFGAQTTFGISGGKVKNVLDDILTDRSTTPKADGTLSVQYKLSQTADVAVEFYTYDGKTVWSLPSRSLQAGFYSHEVPTSGLQPGVYLVRYTCGGYTVTEKTTLK